MSLPKTSDALRNEAVVLQQATERTVRCMSSAVDEVRTAHEKIRALEGAIVGAEIALARDEDIQGAINCLRDVRSKLAF